MVRLLRTLLLPCFLFFGITAFSQLAISPANSALSLAQKLVGEGVTISNVSFTGDANMEMAGHFVNSGGTNINIDSGIVLTSGSAAEVAGNSSLDVSNGFSLPGDLDLETAIGAIGDMSDACVLEFDFVPLGDTIRFRYSFSSEEYQIAFACGNFNDAFGFFISGPGIPGLQNIALVPNSLLPVSIFNVNDVVNSSGTSMCPNNPQYFVDNNGNTLFSHDGVTVVFTAIARVQPCQTYHLKLVIADNFDDQFDSGVFIEARSLSSNAVALINNTQQSPTGDSYQVEGCVPGSFTIRRPRADATPLTVNLTYSGTATNGVDVQTMPSTITIPANQQEVIVDIIPVIDNIPEGIEFIKVYSMAACAAANAIPIDSTIFQIRDYDILGITPDSSLICRNSPIQLVASAGYTTYQWTPATGLSGTNIPNPVATPSGQSTTYIATAQIGTCNARDSAYIEWKMLELVSTQDVNCSGGTTGQIIVSGGSEWASPVEYWVNNGAHQASGTFNNLPVGTHMVHISDAGCTDSIPVTINQAFPDLTFAGAPVMTPGNCTGAASGSITINAAGGRPPYEYSLNGITFQSANLFMVPAGMHSVTVRDANGCTNVYNNIDVPFINSVELATGTDPVICESKSTSLPATGVATSYAWTPAATLDNPNVLNPIANPVVTTTYYVTATTGICTKRDSVTVRVNLAPKPDAGPDGSICFGGTTTLNPGPAVEYKWRPNTFLSSTTVAQPTLRPTNPITYYLKITDANGCESLVEDTMKVFVTPAVRMFAGNDTIIGVGQPLQLNGMQMGQNTVVNYSWTSAYGLNNPNISNPIAILDRDMTYTLTGTTAIGCEGSAVINVKVYKGPEIYVPSVFTPNGDGRNDILRAWAIGMKEYRYFRVFNRWGALVFQTADFNRGWDGRIKGQLQNTGTYVWMAEAVDYLGNVITRKGTTTVIQ